MVSPNDFHKDVPLPWRWVAALAVFVGALLLRFWVLPVEDGLAYLTFYPATVLGFYLCGAGPGWAVVALSAATGYYVFTPPFWTVRASGGGVIAALVFLLSARLIGWIVGRLQSNSAELQVALATLKLSEQRYQGILEDQTELIHRARADGTVLYANAAFCRCFGKSQSELLGRIWHPAIHPDDKPRVRQSLALLSPGNPVVTIDGRMLVAGGEVRWFQFVNRGIFDVRGRLVETQSVGRDITDLKQMQAQIEYVAFHDPLTGLPNRRLMLDRLVQALSLAGRNDATLAVCYLDLDGFKPVNDAHGHDAGDVLLKEVAVRLQACVRLHDTVARQGGDEFIIVLVSLDENREFDLVLQRILSAVSRPVSLKPGIEVAVSGSLGVAFFPSDAMEPELLLRYADQAMYAAKALGGNRYCCHRQERAKA